jgi:hypothetical protein
MSQDVLPADPILELVKGHSFTSALKSELGRLIFDGRIKAGERINEGTLTTQFRYETLLAQRLQRLAQRTAARRNHIGAPRIRMRKALRAAGSIGYSGGMPRVVVLIMDTRKHARNLRGESRARHDPGAFAP